MYVHVKLGAPLSSESPWVSALKSCRPNKVSKIQATLVFTRKCSDLAVLHKGPCCYFLFNRVEQSYLYRAVHNLQQELSLPFFGKINNGASLFLSW